MNLNLPNFFTIEYLDFQSAFNKLLWNIKTRTACAKSCPVTESSPYLSQVNLLTDRPTDRPTHWLIGWLAGWRADRPTDWVLTNWLTEVTEKLLHFIIQERTGQHAVCINILLLLIVSVIPFVQHFNGPDWPAYNWGLELIKSETKHKTRHLRSPLKRNSATYEKYLVFLGDGKPSTTRKGGSKIASLVRCITPM